MSWSDNRSGRGGGNRFATASVKRPCPEDERPAIKASRFAVHRPAPPPPVGPPPAEVVVRPTPAVAAPDDGRPRRMFVGNLELTINEGDILKIFAKFGTVTGCVFLHHFSGPLRGKPKGFCFVEMQTHGQAEGAIAALNGRKLRGRELRVNFSKESEGFPSASSCITKPSGSSSEEHSSAHKSTDVDERLLARRAAMVKMTLQRMGVDPTQAVLKRDAAEAAATRTTGETSNAVTHEDSDDNVVADIINE